MTPLKPYRELLRELLDAGNLTPRIVEALSKGGVTAKTVNNHLAGRGAPSEDKVQSIADVLELRHALSLGRRLELLAAAAEARRVPQEAVAIRPVDAYGREQVTDRFTAAIRGNSEDAAPHRPRRLLFALLAVILISVGALTTAARAGSNRSSHQPVASVEAPTDGQGVASPLVVKGTAAVPAGQELWLLVQPADGRFYLTGDKKPIHVDNNGVWSSSSMRLGRDGHDIGLASNLWIVMAPIGGLFSHTVQQRLANNVHGGFAALPTEVIRVASVHVTLVKYHGAPYDPSKASATTQGSHA